MDFANSAGPGCARGPAGPAGAEPPVGYRSADSRRRFMLAAGLLAGACLVGQFVVPFVLMLVWMPFFMFSAFSLELASPGDGAFWNGRVWYLSRSESPFPERSGGTGPWLCSLEPEGRSGPEKVAELPLSPAPPTAAPSRPATREPVLLAGNDRLWIVSDAAVGFFQDGRLTFPSSDEAPGEASRPFLRGGRPAVVAGSKAGPVVKVLDGGSWRVAEPAPWLAGVASFSELRVVEAGGELHAFLPERAGLFHRRSSTGDGLGSWQPAGAASHGPWAVLSLGGKPVLFQSSPADGAIVGRVWEGGAWREFVSRRTFVAGEMGAFPGGGPEDLLVLYQTFPGRLSLLDVSQGRVRSRTGYGRGFPFSGGFVLLSVLPGVLAALLSLVLACLLSGQMRRHRDCAYSWEGRRAVFAPLWRRGLAHGIDALIAHAPLGAVAAVFLSRFGDFEDLLDPAWLLSLLGLAVAAGGWSLAAFLVFRFMEGRGGQTPGKRLLGIRVVGLDLQPCGFGRSLVRGLLMVADSFFNNLVGIMLVAFSERWQRLGDLAAKTIVIRVRPG